MAMSMLQGADVVLLLAGLVLTAGAIVLIAGMWRSEERFRALISYLLFLRARRRAALLLFSGMAVAFCVAAAISGTDSWVGWDPAVADVATALANFLGAGALFLLAFLIFRERTLSEDDRALLRAGHFSMYAQFGPDHGDLVAGPDEPALVYPGSPRPPRST